MERLDHRSLQRTEPFSSTSIAFVCLYGATDTTSEMIAEDGVVADAASSAAEAADEEATTIEEADLLTQARTL